MTALLTTHILDLTHGSPASGVMIELYYKEDTKTECVLLKTAVTNDDGKLDKPLLSKEEAKIGIYEITFHIGAYFRSKETSLPNPAFLETVPVRFSLSDPTAHYHVPLLVSPWGYQVYRGS